MKDYIYIKGAKEHNLKNIDIKIPRDKLVVFSGVSGSGLYSLPESPELDELLDELEPVSSLVQPTKNAPQSDKLKINAKSFFIIIPFMVLFHYLYFITQKEVCQSNFLFFYCISLFSIELIFSTRQNIKNNRNLT